MLEVIDGTWQVTGALATPRLVLRPHRTSDLDDLLLFHSDAEVTRYIPWPVRDRQETAAALETKISQVSAADGAWLVLAIVHADDDVVIGEVLLKRASATSGEIGYVVSRGYQRAGYASEAVLALMGEAIARLGVTSFTAVVAAENDASHRLLERHGFERAPDAGSDASLVRWELAVPTNKRRPDNS